MIAWVSDDTLYTINSLEILAIIYLAIAVSYLRERLSKLEGKDEQQERNHQRRG